MRSQRTVSVRFIFRFCNFSLSSTVKSNHLYLERQNTVSVLFIFFFSNLFSLSHLLKWIILTRESLDVTFKTKKYIILCKLHFLIQHVILPSFSSQSNIRGFYINNSNLTVQITWPKEEIDIKLLDSSLSSYIKESNEKVSHSNVSDIDRLLQSH